MNVVEVLTYKGCLGSVGGRGHEVMPVGWDIFVP